MATITAQKPFAPMLFVFEPETDNSVEFTVAEGPRKAYRLLCEAFPEGDWDPKHRAKVALLIADFTAGEGGAGLLRMELARADLKVTYL